MRGRKVDYLTKEFGFLVGLFIDSFGLLNSPLSSPAPLSPKRALGHFLFYSKGGEKILCNPPQNLPKSSPEEPFRKKIRVQTYILSEHNYRRGEVKICRFGASKGSKLRNKIK